MGSDNGESTTIDISECSLHLNGKNVLIYDTPGMNDSQLRLSNRDIKRKLEFHLATTLTTSLDAFILFESLHSESITVRRNLATLVEVFGPQVQQSCVVLLTKEPHSVSRSQNLQNICNNLGIPFVFWENNRKAVDTGTWMNVDQSQLTNQINDLTRKIASVKNYEISTLKSLKDEILREATQRQKNEPASYESVSYTVEVPYQEPEVKAVTKQRPVEKKVWDGEVGKWIGKKKTVIKWENYTDHETIYHNRTRTETRTSQVEKPKKSVDYYVDIVKQERIAAFKQNLTQNFERQLRPSL